MICVIVKRNIIWADLILISWLGCMNHDMIEVISSNRDFYVILKHLRYDLCDSQHLWNIHMLTWKMVIF
jgi:hypothetical protein